MFKYCLTLSALALLLLASCSSNGCYETTDVKVYCNFYSLDSAFAVKFDSVSVWGVGSDSLLYKDLSVNEIGLELNPKAQETRYVIQIKAKGSEFYFRDTISLYHTNQPWFQSMECGCMVFSTLDSCKTTGSIFQSATILDSSIINKKTEHVVLNF